MTEEQSLHRGRFLELVSQNGWEFVRRANCTTTVAILAVTENDELLFVEQFRPPIGAEVLELPAGLVGDDPGQGTEEVAIAANRELEEETGFTARSLHTLGTFCSSAGLTDETTTICLAVGCRQTGPGGGIGGESIRIHKIPRNEAASWLAERVKSGQLLDGKVWTAFALAERAGFSDLTED
ncbi:NUDIX hydrolase [Rubinisphaera margarita]|uniref:NUDIX hydrolase n=1 Tax=Rubinisphaera margarita TaxID=2909586 RepID=UPI001EE8D5FF|nr:NUDIX hydrolase [Rubinisphaera margarita]MCG6155367.1 NUDIX hydrolase [Rubinisphaera margarita]